VTARLVPDGVSQVGLSFPAGRVSVGVVNNFWQAKAPGVTPSAIVWKDAQGREIDPAHAARRSGPLTPPPPKVKVITTHLHVHVGVLRGHRIRFTPRTGPHRYVIALTCGRSGFDGAITKPLAAGTAVTVPLKLAAAGDQCPGRRVLAGRVVQLSRRRSAPHLGVAGARVHVVVLGTFRLRI
jgi:hypothetical protein